MFTELEEINSRPEPFQYYTAEELWADSSPATLLGSGQFQLVNVEGSDVYINFIQIFSPMIYWDYAKFKQFSNQ